MMRIGFITTEYVTEENYAGGLANYLNRVARGLVQKGHLVEIFVLSDVKETLEHDKVLVHRVKRNTFLYKLFSVKFPKTFKVLIDAWSLKRAVLRRHKKEPLNIIQAPNYLAAGVLLARSKKIPVVTRLSTFAPLWRTVTNVGSNFDISLSEILELLQFRASKSVYAPSEILKHYVEKYEPIQVEHILPPFVFDEVDIDNSILSNYKGSHNYLLFFGSIMPLKGVDFIFKNLEDILSKNINIDFIFIGRFGNAEDFKKAAGRHSGRVHYFNSMPKQQLRAFIQDARAVILPSIIDNLPNTCLESMALGKAVLTTTTSGFEGIIHHEQNGYLIEYGNDLQFQETVKNICNQDSDVLRIIGKRAKETIRLKFSTELTLDRLIQEYKEAAGI